MAAAASLNGGGNRGPAATHRWTVSGRPDGGAAVAAPPVKKEKGSRRRCSAPSAVVLDCSAVRGAEGVKKEKQREAASVGRLEKMIYE